jgi:SH3-like domain-containing protein
MRRSSLIKSFCVSSRVGIFFWQVFFLSISSYAVAEMEYFSIAENAAVMYDAPSLKADKLYVASLYLPVEAVVNVDGWVKVRDSSGSLAWVEKRMLSQQRYVVVIVPLADVYQSADTNSELIFQAEENIVLELLDSEHRGWVKVRHSQWTSRLCQD